MSGAGKSTLLKLMCGDINASVGIVKRNPHLRIGRYMQHSVDQLGILSFSLPLSLSSLSFFLFLFYFLFLSFILCSFTCGRHARHPSPIHEEAICPHGP